MAVVRARAVSHVEVLTPDERAALAGRPTANEGAGNGASEAPGEATAGGQAGGLSAEQQFQIAANRFAPFCTPVFLICKAFR